jgi:hypothetical protein
MGYRTQAKPVSQTMQNLVLNSSFEAPSPAFWYNAGSSAGTVHHLWSADMAHSGAFSVAVVGLASVAEGAWWSEPFVVQVNEQYSLSGWIKTDNILLDAAFISLAFYSSISEEDLIAEIYSSPIVSTTGWIELTIDTIAPANARYARVFCRLYGQGIVWFDDVTVNGVVSLAYLPLMMNDFAIFCNGGFETGDFACWTDNGDLARSVQSSIVYDGSYAALLGSPHYSCRDGVPVGETSIAQFLIVPSCSKPVLSFEYRIFSSDVLRDDKWDSFDVFVDNDFTKTLILRDGNTVWSTASCDQTWDSGWKHFSYDLSRYSGNTIEVSFHNVNRADHWYNTWTYVDQVEVICQ